MSSGELRLYLSAAPGAGATYAMLDEGRRRCERGTRILIGCIDTRGRPATAAMLDHLRDAVVGEGGVLDVDSILAERPQVILVDDVAVVDDVNGSQVARWAGVSRLLDAGIDVVATIRIDQVESLADEAALITGLRWPHPVPDSFLMRAGQIEVVDITPEAIQRRIAHGNVFDPTEMDPTRSNLFQSGSFMRLRAMLFAYMARRTAIGSTDESAVGIGHSRRGGFIGSPRASATLAPPAMSLARRVAALCGGLSAMALLTVLLVTLRAQVSVSTGLALYLLAVVATSAAGGWLPGLVTGLVAPLLANWFLIEPYHTLRINYAQDTIELSVFLSVAVIVSAFVTIASRRAREAEESRREASTLATLAASAGPDPLRAITGQLLGAFGFAGVAVFAVSDGGTQLLSSAGERPPADPFSAQFCESVSEGIFLAATGRTLTAEDHRVLGAFVKQLGRAVEQQRIAELAAEADAISRADELRTGILRAVSHDLRTPLSNIKAAVSSLRQRDVAWTDNERAEFLETIEDESDRLTGIITNLLDMSRLEAGVVAPQVRQVSLEEIVPTVLHRLGAAASRVEVQLPESLPDIETDPALLERVVANLLTNALEWSPADAMVKIIGHEQAEGVQLYVVDHGPGIHPRDRAAVMRPFHRLSDSGRQGGVGLGLAIARGLTIALGGTFELRDTAGGGVTAVIMLPRSANIGNPVPL